MTDIDKLVTDKLVAGKITDEDADAVLSFRDFLQIAGPPADKGGHPIRNLRWAGREDLIEWALGASYVAPKPVLIEFDIPAEPLNMNHGDGREARRQFVGWKMEWKNASYYAACQAFPGVGPRQRFQPPSTVHVSIPVADIDRRRDPINYAPTTKVIVDQLVRAECWPDDTPEYVTQEIPSLRRVPAAQLWKSKVIVRIVPRSTS